MPDATETLLTEALRLAVPLWIERMRNLSPEERIERARAQVDTLASKGDLILYRGAKKGESAAAFNALAEGMAALAFCPGGVTAFGLHFEVRA